MSICFPCACFHLLRLQPLVPDLAALIILKWSATVWGFNALLCITLYAVISASDHTMQNSKLPERLSRAEEGTKKKKNSETSICTVTFKWRNAPTEPSARSKNRNETPFTEQDLHLVAVDSSRSRSGFWRTLKSVSYERSVLTLSMLKEGSGIFRFISVQGMWCTFI